ncbi:hypothetical protein Tco_1576438 [Tanacetum coccineum]
MFEGSIGKGNRVLLRSYTLVGQGVEGLAAGISHSPSLIASLQRSFSPTFTPEIEEGKSLNLQCTSVRPNLPFGQNCRVECKNLPASEYSELLDRCPSPFAPAEAIIIAEALLLRRSTCLVYSFDGISDLIRYAVYSLRPEEGRRAKSWIGFHCCVGMPKPPSRRQRSQLHNPFPLSCSSKWTNRDNQIQVTKESSHSNQLNIWLGLAGINNEKKNYKWKQQLKIWVLVGPDNVLAVGVPSYAKISRSSNRGCKAMCPFSVGGERLDLRNVSENSGSLVATLPLDLRCEDQDIFFMTSIPLIDPGPEKWTDQGPYLMNDKKGLYVPFDRSDIFTHDWPCRPNQDIEGWDLFSKQNGDAMFLPTKKPLLRKLQSVDRGRAEGKIREISETNGHYWPTVLADYIAHAKSCDACQRYAGIQHKPASELYPIIKPWPFRGWAMDIFGKDLSQDLRGHTFISIVATAQPSPLCTRVEARASKNVTSTESRLALLEIIREGRLLSVHGFAIILWGDVTKLKRR